VAGLSCIRNRGLGGGGPISSSDDNQKACGFFFLFFFSSLALIFAAPQSLASCPGNHNQRRQKNEIREIQNTLTTEHLTNGQSKDTVKFQPYLWGMLLKMFGFFSTSVSLASVRRCLHVFSIRKQKLCIYFSLNKAAKNLKTICACTESTNLIFTGLQSKYPSGDPSPIRHQKHSANSRFYSGKKITYKRPVPGLE
jgi:hypothetical protein